MSQQIKSQLIQARIKKQTDCVSLLNNLTKQDHRCIDFMYYAQYDIILHSFEMKNAAYLQKKLVQKQKRLENDLIKRKFIAQSEKIHERILNEDNMVDRSLNRLQAKWEQAKVPFFHRYYFEKYINNDMKLYMQNLKTFILNEEKLIKNGSHVIFSLEKTVLAREACLQQMKQRVSAIGDSDIQQHFYTCRQRQHHLRSLKEKLQYQIQGFKTNKIFDEKVTKNIFNKTKLQLFGVNFHHLVKLNIHIIELATKWRQYLYSFTVDRLKSREPIQFYFKEQNYLLKMINDNNFLQRSLLANYYKFAPRNDPFLFKPIRQIEQIERQLSGQQYQPSYYHQLQQNSISARSFQRKCLQKIIAPNSLHQLLQILQKFKVLLGEYQKNIKNRKVFDLRLISKVDNLQLARQNNCSRSHHSTKRKSFNSQKSTRRQTDEKFRVTSQSGLKFKRHTQDSQFQNKSQRSQKKTSNNKLLLNVKPNYQSFNNFNNNNNKTYSLKNSLLIKSNLRKTQNPEQQRNSNSNKQLQKDENSLLFVKQQLLQKLKQDLGIKNNSNSSLQKILSQKQYLLSLSQSYNQQKSNTIQIETYSIQENALQSHLTFLYEKQSLFEFHFLQKQKSELLTGSKNNQHGKNLKTKSLNRQQKGLQSMPSFHFLRVFKYAHKQKDLKRNKLLVSINDNNSIKNYNTIQNTTRTTNMSSTPTSNCIVLSDVIVSSKHCNNNDKKYTKQMQIHYMTIKSANVIDLSKVIFKIVQFLFKYETGKAIYFKFYHNESNYAQKQFVTKLKLLLKEFQGCEIKEKYFDKDTGTTQQTIIQVTFKFVKNEKHQKQQEQHQEQRLFSNKNYQSKTKSILNNNNNKPLSLHVGLYALISKQKLNKIPLAPQLIKDFYQKSCINYDYMLTQIVMNHLSADDILFLRNHSNSWSHRLKVIIENILRINAEQDNKNQVPFISEHNKFLQAENITELNKLLYYQNKKVCFKLQQNHSKSNSIKMIPLQLSLTLPYSKTQAFINKNGQRYFRFSVKRQVQIWKMKLPKQILKNQNFSTQQQNQQFIQSTMTNMLLFPTIQRNDVKIGFFDTTNIIKFVSKSNTTSITGSQKQLLKSSWITNILSILSFDQDIKNQKFLRFSSSESSYVNHMFLPMTYPSSCVQSNKDNTQTIQPVKIDELNALNQTQIFIGENSKWNYDINLQNGIRFKADLKNNDIQFKSGKTALVVWLLPQRIVVYSRII